jgi:hypothetical protein
MTTNWQTRAAEALEQGYQPGNNWEAMLGRHLARCFPALVTELGPDLTAYLRATTFDAMLLAEKMEEQGMATELAEELAREQLLQTPPDETEKPTRTELEESQDNQEQAAMRHLLNDPSAKPPPRKTPPI